MADEVEGKHKKKMKKKAKHKLEKRKRDSSSEQENTLESKILKTDADGTRSTGRHFTVSLALPGSILDNAQSPELRTYLAGQIARALAVFSIDEVVVFDESGKARSESNNGLNRKSDPNILLARILQYLECPQYLRKDFFPKHSDLQYAGLLNPLDTPHHMKVDDDMPYREGVVLERPARKGYGSSVNVGMRKEVRIDRTIKPGLRVTVKMDNTSGTKFYTGTVVSPAAPRTEQGLYWGYSVRLAPSFGAVFTQSPYKDGYDVTIGTSERGTIVDDLVLPNFRHLLVVFGGLKGLETSLESDETLSANDPSLVFDHYVNTCPGQGSGTIRTEEAILVTMSALRPIIAKSKK